ncbi:MAG: SRPBCC domain-containing protein [Bacteroidota bacterium]
MNNALMMNFTVDKQAKTIHVEREFAAPLSKVWAAWTRSEILDKWWAPKPWQARTKEMDFREGGRWVYAMVSPEGEEHWSFADYKAITPLKSFSAQDGFCDENGNISTAMPRSNWTNNFKEDGDSTVVSINITYDKLEDLEKIIEMGFQGGFTMGLGNLDELLAREEVAV